jgi:uncharacterized protein YyaL (SSP411 family)
MISAFARAYQVVGDEAYLKAANRAADFIDETLYQDESNILLRRYRQGDAAIEGYADDYAYFIQGLLDLYEASFDVERLTWAIQLQKKQDALFWDESTGGYFNTAGQDDRILLRLKGEYDGAKPSPSSVARSNTCASTTATTTFSKSVSGCFGTSRTMSSSG